jgi:hypothetical protein
VVVVAMPEAVSQEIDFLGKASILDSRQVKFRLKARRLASVAVGSVNLEEINRGLGGAREQLPTVRPINRPAGVPTERRSHRKASQEGWWYYHGSCAGGWCGLSWWKCNTSRRTY